MTEDDKPPVDPRYVAAVKAQQAVKKQMTARKRPILRLVWDADTQPKIVPSSVCTRYAHGDA